MKKTYKYRLYPSPEQVAFLESQLREAASLYNAALEERREAWRMQRVSRTYYDQANQLKEIRAEGLTGLVNAQCSQDVLRRLDKAYKAFFRRIKAYKELPPDKQKERKCPGPPRFRSFRRYDSITFPTHGDGGKLMGNRLRVQGVGCIKVKLHRPVDGAIKTVTIKRSAGKWDVCLSVECEAKLLSASNKAVGLDVGLTHFAVLDSGAEIENPRYYKKAQAALRMAHRRVARRPDKRSQGRRKAVVLLQKAAGHVTNQRADFHHKEARKLVDKYGLIAVEDLNVKGLAGGMLAKSVHDAGWSAFIGMLSCKAEEAGRTLVKVDPRGTTQRCSGCGETVPKTLKDRWHDCPSCGLSLSRDHNAARNILGLGLSLAASTWRDASCVAAEAVCLS